MSYLIYGNKKDGTKQLLGEGYPSRAYAYASATKWAVDCRVAGNPGGFDSLIVTDDKGELLPEYANDKLLQVAKNLHNTRRARKQDIKNFVRLIRQNGSLSML